MELPILYVAVNLGEIPLGEEEYLPESFSNTISTKMEDGLVAKVGIVRNFISLA